MTNQRLKLLVRALLLASIIVCARAESSTTNGVTAPTELSTALASAPASTVYRLHPNDMIEVHIYGEDELTSKVKLSESGTVVLPLLPAL